MNLLARFKGLSSKIYFAFLVAAGMPVMVAGLVGIYSSLETLRQETLHHLEQEVHGRAAGMGHFFDQLASEILYLASSSLLYDLANSTKSADGKLPAVARQRLERDYAAFARASGSSRSSRRGAISTWATCAPRRAKAWVSSQPMGPPPSTTRRRGSVRRFQTVSEVR